MKEAYNTAFQNTIILREAFEFAGVKCACGVDSNSFTPWVRLNVEYLEQIEFSFCFNYPNATRATIVDMARRLAGQHSFSFDLIFPTQKPMRISGYADAHLDKVGA